MLAVSNCCVGAPRTVQYISSSPLVGGVPQADAEALPFEDDSFHLYTIAFGLRNVTDVSNAALGRC